MKRLIVFMLSLCTLCGSAMAAQPETELSAKAQKALQKAQKKQLRQEIRRFELLRNDAVVEFAREHQPSDISTPSFINDFRVSKVICAGDINTGVVILHFDITPLYGGFKIFMGGERNGTCAFADGVSYPSSNQYGRVYTMRGAQPEHVVITFYNVVPGVKLFNRIDVSMGLALNLMNIITMRDIPIFWTYSNKAIRNYVRENTTKETIY